TVAWMNDGPLRVRLPSPAIPAMEPLTPTPILELPVSVTFVGPPRASRDQFKGEAHRSKSLMLNGVPGQALNAVDPNIPKSPIVPASRKNFIIVRVIR